MGAEQRGSLSVREVRFFCLPSSILSAPSLFSSMGILSLYLGGGEGEDYGREAAGWGERRDVQSTE